jgi:DNA mismatch repair protein MutS2
MSNLLATYPGEFKNKIGFEKISQLLESHCVSTPGKELVEHLKPSSVLSEINTKLDMLRELMLLLGAQGATIPEQGFYDLRKELDFLNVEESWWEPESFIDLRSLLRTSESLLKLLKKQESAVLKELYEHIVFPDHLLRQLDKIFTDQGEVSDNASPELGKVRRTIEQNRHQVRKNLELIFRNARKEGWVPEGASISVRDGRMVIPLVAEAKRRIRGFIHDESATGQTVFMEPAAVLEGNNKQRELEYEERREVIKILKKASKEVNRETNSIHNITTFMGEVDFLRAKIKLAQRLHGIKPVMSPESVVKLKGARHPILILTEHNVVPLDITLDHRQRIVLISGPNAGGKSVALKTVALLQYMVQCGLFVPVAEGSLMGIFDQLYIDIGDEQSIENDLSTYSSHLQNMHFMLQNVNERSLILIDEFGSGTEPHFGGALAEGMLEDFVQCGARGVITTHYANLKTYAEKQEGVVNAAMLFDIDKLQPLYRLSIGKPGSSHALDIARNTGLPQRIIDRAKTLLGRGTIDYDKALAELQGQLKKVQEREQLLHKREQQSKSLIEEYSRLKESIESNRKQMIANAKTEAEALVAKANKEIEKTIRHIKENKAEKKETRLIRQRLEDFKQQNKSAADQKEFLKSTEKTDRPLSKGDYVEVKESNVVGQIMGIQGNKAEVLLGDLKTMVKLNRLERVNRKEMRQQKSGRKSGTDFTSKRASFSSTLDIRGKRAEEALAIVDKFIDDAILAGAQEVKVLHGKGNGILKEIVRNHLKGYKQVHHMEDEHIERGGSGITVVNLDA